MSTSRTISLGSGSGSGGGAMTLVGTATVAGAAATTLALASIDLSLYKAFQIVFALDNATGSAAVISLYYNADTTATNYNEQAFTINGASVTGARANDARVTNLDANETVTGTITISNDRDSKPRAEVFTNRGASASLIMGLFAHSWTSATNITTITFSSAVANSLAIGSTFTVWGIT